MNSLPRTRIIALAVLGSAAALVGSPTLPAQEALRRDGERGARRLPEIRLISADGRSAVFEYRPRFLDRQKVTVVGTPYALFDFEGSIVERRSDNIGFPDLRFRHIPVGLPGRDGAVVRIASVD